MAGTETDTLTITTHGYRSPMDTPKRTCKAKRTNGEPCRAPAMRGQMVCQAHGGSSPQARHKAAERIFEAIDPAVAEHIRLVHEAKSERDRLYAIKLLYDQADLARLIAAVAEVGGPAQDVEEIIRVAWPDRKW